jgi:asparagine synthase (glutamine-hydrolysing)
MCGICGKMNFDPDAGVSPSLLRGMADTIQHRGPDDQGYFVSGQVGLGFRRLSIIDVAAGHQPLSNEDGNVWIVFNGEIYNYRELRELLLAKGHVFKTHTDTEVIVHLYEEHGESCVEMLRGMFAFAIWDNRKKNLFVARDRVGIKPFYYWKSDRSFVFASEIKAILADPDVKAEVDPQVLDRFLTFYHVPGEETLFRNIRRLPPGSYMLITGNKAEIKTYWDLHFAPTTQSSDEAEQKLVALLDDCVRLHMISDVPVGFLLSGGIDSTAMLSFAAGKTDLPLVTFTIGFSADNVTDERPYARLAAQRYGAEYHDMTISSKQFADLLPTYTWHIEEPVCEPAAIALYYVSRLAKSFVKVLISGEGGDEAFAGYPNYRNLLWLERLKSICKPANGMISLFISLIAQLLHSPRVARYAPLMNLPLESYYYSRVSNPFTFFNTAIELYSKDFNNLVDRHKSASPVRGYFVNASKNSLLNKMLYVDTKSWLPDDLLLKADKMTMANSVELRVPFLDHLLLEFAASLPEDLKLRWFSTKYIAKKALSGRVPSEILSRKKAGFPVPYNSWLRTELKDWVADILLDRSTLARGYFNRTSVEKLIERNEQSGAYSKEIHSLIALEMWHRTFLSVRTVSEQSELNPSTVLQ